MAEGQNPSFLSDTRMCRLNRSEPFARNPFFSMTAWATRRRYEQHTGDLRLLMPTHLLSRERCQWACTQNIAPLCSHCPKASRCRRDNLIHSINGAGRPSAGSSSYEIPDCDSEIPAGAAVSPTQKGALSPLLCWPWGAQYVQWPARKLRLCLGMYMERFPAVCRGSDSRFAKASFQ